MFQESLFYVVPSGSMEAYRISVELETERVHKSIAVSFDFGISGRIVLNLALRFCCRSIMIVENKKSYCSNS